MLLERKIIELDKQKTKMVISGWGEDAIANSTVEKIYYLSDGLKTLGYIGYPTHHENRKFPCLIWNRGGYADSGTIDEFNARGIFGKIASWGYVVFASQYRGSSGSEGVDEFGGLDLNDVLNLIPLANEIHQADPSIWGIEGWSRGGMQTYLALTKTNIFKTAIITGGIANLKSNAEANPFMRSLYNRALPKTNMNNIDEFFTERSIVNFPELLPKNCPILILHGAEDERVSPIDSIEITKKAIELKIPCRLIILEGGDHFLKSHRKETDELRKNWLSKYLCNT